MTTIQTGASIGAILVLLIMALLFLRRAIASGAVKGGDHARNRDGTFPHVCSVCGDETLITPEALHSLSSAEKALAVRECAQALGKDLVEYVCRSCDASHCFSISGGRAVAMGVNLYEGQRFGSRCGECQRELVAPPWELGRYDGRINSAPGPIDALGLVCRHCDAVCCVACCEYVTRKRTDDGTLLCPRCFRGPQDVFFIPNASSLGNQSA